MTTDIAIPEPEPSYAPLAVWADSARRAAGIAVSLAKTPFVPASLRGTTDDVTAANVTAVILTGQEIGVQPMASLRSIDIIQGTPAMRAMALRALVQSKGHRVWVEEATETRAIVKGVRRGEDQVQSSTWTMDRAKGLSLIGKDNWRKQPQAMLIARATSELCRLVAADVILGVPYSIEELQDGDEQQAPTETGQPAPKPRRTAQRRLAVAELPEPTAPEPDPTPVEPEPVAAETVAEQDGQLWPEPPADWEPTA